MREIVAAAWADSPLSVVLAVLLTPVVLAAIWGLLVVAIVAGQP